MGLTSSLYTSLSGLNVNSQLISVTGNNIANVNTHGFKSSRISFETQIQQTMDTGAAPSDAYGGTNPTQIGLGVRLAGTSRDFSNGSLQLTGVNTDMAIDGAGFYMLEMGGRRYFTRDGAFSLDRDFNLTRNGGLVQGYAVNDDFEVVEGVLSNLNIPLGALTIAEATRNVRFSGNLNASGEVASTGAQILGTEDILDGGVAATAASNLEDLTIGGVSAFAVGDVITVSGVIKGSATLPAHTFEVTSPAAPDTVTTGSEAHGATLDDLLNFLNHVLGIQTTDEAGNPLTGGATITPAGRLSIQGNSGTGNDLQIESTNIAVNLGSVSPTRPFNLMKTGAADGESVRTTFVAYDSLGTPLTLNLTIVLEAKTAAGTDWRFYVESEDDTDMARSLENGELHFDTNGQLVSVDNDTFEIDRVGTGAASPQAIRMTFADGSGSLSALTDTQSQIASLSQDGSPIGTLQDFSIGGDGTIRGVFSNSLSRTLGQLILATFTNPQGLMELGGNLFAESVNSGTPAVFVPGSGGAGTIVGGALELSNVELSQEFINLISASTGFSANSRVLTTSDRLIQELIAAIR